jgi:hypothetical protein
VSINLVFSEGLASYSLIQLVKEFGLRIFYKLRKMKENHVPAEMPGPGVPRNSAGTRRGMLGRDLRASGFAVTRPDWEAGAWDFPPVWF